MGDHMWVNTAWRVPWRRKTGLDLEAHVVLPAHSVLDNLGLSGIKRLPLEVLDMIREFSADSVFWRYNTVLDFSRGLSSLPSTPRQVMPLDRVRAWQRGELPITEKEGDPHLPVMRLTIDVKGIRKIERLSEHPRFKPGRTDHLAFIVLDEDSIIGIRAMFKVGHSYFTSQRDTR